MRRDIDRTWVSKASALSRKLRQSMVNNIVSFDVIHSV